MWRRLLLLVLAISRISLDSPAATKPEHALKPDRSVSLFSGETLPRLKITIAESELAGLRKDNRSYVRASISDGKRSLTNVGLRLKGMGSFRPFDQKPSFALKFDKFQPAQKYFGLTKLLLNNGSQDPSYLAEKTTTEIFRDAGLPAARVTQGRVEVNGRDLGIYVVVEAMNKDFLRRHFRSPEGNLYEGYTQEVDQTLDLDNGPPSPDQADRKALVAAANVADPGERLRRLNGVLEVDRFLSFIALEMMTSLSDGYELNRNNYRIYHDPVTDRFTFITHGQDFAFGNPGLSIHPPGNSLLVRALWSAPGIPERYRQRVETLFRDALRPNTITNRIQSALANLRTVAIGPAEKREIEIQANAFSGRVLDRLQQIEQQLNAEPRHPEFSAQKIAELSGWYRKVDAGSPRLEQMNEAGKILLRIAAGESAVASWRVRVLLPTGKYRFEGKARSSGLVPLSDKTPVGGGLRISGSPRQNQLVGDTGWTILQHEFVKAAGEAPIELVCELRAKKGEILFDASSMRLIKVQE